MSYSEPASGGYAVTPSDSTILTKTPRALWVGVSGDLVLVFSDESTATIKGAVGLIPVRAKKVMSSTTCTDIVALY